MIILGIDSGQSGALVAIDGNAGLVDSWEMPATKGVGLNMGPLQVILKSLLLRSTSIYAFLEKAQAFPGDGVAGLFSYARDYGRIQGVLHCARIPCTLVPPRTWQGPILGTIAHKALPDGFEELPKKEKAKIKRTRKLARRALIKARGVQVCQERLPGLNLLPRPRMRKPHDGLSDAGCIALFGWLQVPRCP